MNDEDLHALDYWILTKDVVSAVGSLYEEEIEDGTFYSSQLWIIVANKTQYTHTHLARQDGRADADAHVVLDLVVQHVHRLGRRDDVDAVVAGVRDVDRG